MNKKKTAGLLSMAVLCCMGFACGMVGKKMMHNTVRMGYDDPTTIVTRGTLCNMDALEQEVIQKGLPEKPEEVDTTNKNNVQ